MAAMRVHELAKEFGMTSKELLSRLRDMKIPAKSHASVLNDAYVNKIRKNISPEIKERAGVLADDEKVELDKQKQEAEEAKQKEEAARRAAMEHELAEREAARARRATTTGPRREEQTTDVRLRRSPHADRKRAQTRREGKGRRRGARQGRASRCGSGEKAGGGSRVAQSALP